MQTRDHGDHQDVLDEARARSRSLDGGLGRAASVDVPGRQRSPNVAPVRSVRWG